MYVFPLFTEEYRQSANDSYLTDMFTHQSSPQQKPINRFASNDFTNEFWLYCLLPENQISLDHFFLIRHKHLLGFPEGGSHIHLSLTHLKTQQITTKNNSKLTFHSRKYLLTPRNWVTSSAGSLCRHLRFCNTHLAQHQLTSDMITDPILHGYDGQY